MIFVVFQRLLREAFSLQRIFPARFLSRFWLFALAFLVPSLYSSSFIFPQSQALTCKSKGDTKISVSAPRDSVSLGPCREAGHGGDLHVTIFPPSVELAGYDYRTLLNRSLEKSSCKLTKPGFVSRNGVSTQ